jgi:hypothetical protein
LHLLFFFVKKIYFYANLVLFIWKDEQLACLFKKKEIINHDNH